ncbi:MULTISPECIES: SCO2400 family protein [Streptomyces]|uniref:Zinc ribbon domain-containing protein n=1 Tax=Streptomyces edwardsiae TaxID=3075527 RepID=A0ABU2QP49_9ACTN|nr:MULTISPECIES: hypothetical protein [unclassified Streptomyces]MDT0405811.1 hypothetical protein [Streptomyces sp. DSM 41635]
MDYCSTCRRHLNGALVCPGCGAYAPDIAPSVIGGHTVPGTATAATASEAGVRPPAPRPDDVPEPAAVAAPTGTGRAARRRQVARWKKTQRRALVATAVALVGGGLTLASMDRGGGDRAQAASAPDLRGMGGGKDLADEYDDLDDVPSASPERAERAPSAGDRRSAEAAPAPGTPSDTRTESAAVSDTAVTSQPSSPSQRRTASPDTGARAGAEAGADSGSATQENGGSGTATPPATPPPAAGDNGGGSGSGTDQGQTTPSAPSTTAPDPQLCLLVICLG